MKTTYRFSYQLSVLLSAMVLAAQTLTAQTSSINIVSTAVPFLRISPDARAGGMGDMSIATAPDANAAFWNLAKIPFAKNQTAVAVNYTPWLKDLGLSDVYLASLAGYHKLNDESAVSTSLRFFSLGNIQLTDFSGNILNNIRPSEFSVDLGYSRIISEKISLGVALRYINSRLVIGDVGTGVVYRAGTSVAGDVSMYYNGTDESGAGLTWGITLANLGAKIGYTNDARNKDFIPANLGVGIAYTTVMDGNNRLMFGMDINKLLVPSLPAATGVFSTDSASLSNYRSTGVVSSWLKSFGDGTNQLDALQVSLGAEYAYNEQFFVRGGYFHESKSRGNRQYFSLGAGFSMDAFQVNLSYLVPSGSGITRNPLSNTIRVGLVFNISSQK